MTRILREYITEKVGAEKAPEIIHKVDDFYDEAIDFGAESIIESGLIDTIIEEAINDNLQERDLPDDEDEDED